MAWRACLRAFVSAAARLGGRGFLQQRFDLPSCLFPLPAKRSHEHGLDDAQDRASVGVVRPELAPLGRVEPALEQRAEDRRLDLAPVQGGCARRMSISVGCQRQDVGVREQAAVEMWIRSTPNRPPSRHRVEQILSIEARSSGSFAPASMSSWKSLAREQTDVFGEQAEQHPVQEVGDLAWLVAALAQPLGERSEFSGRLLGDLFDAGPAEGLGSREEGLEKAARFFLLQVGQVELVDSWRCP